MMSFFALKENYQYLYIATVLEKFCFHGVRFVLVLFCIRDLHIDGDRAFLFYGSLMSIAYLMPSVSGYFLDKERCPRFLSLLAVSFMSLACVLLCLKEKNAMYLGLTLLATGAGVLRGVLPILFGEQVAVLRLNPHEKFSTLYFFINVGSFISSIFAALIGEILGFEYYFSILFLFSIFCGFCINKYFQTIVYKLNKRKLYIRHNFVLSICFLLIVFIVRLFIVYDFFLKIEGIN